MSTTLLFGGSFDPPHLAHTQLSKWVADALGIPKVLFMLAAKAPHKVGQTQAPAEHRLKMLELALKDCAWASLSTLELERARANPTQLSFTVDTLEALKAQFPSENFRLLMGSDQLRIFHQWKSWQRVEALAEPVVMVRAPETKAEILAHLPKEFDQATWAKRLVEVPPMHVSSMQLRRRVAAGEALDGFVTPQVAAYIAAHRLYS